MLPASFFTSSTGLSALFKTNRPDVSIASPDETLPEVDSILECSSHCKSDPKCQTFNFVRKQKVCQISRLKAGILLLETAVGSLMYSRWSKQVQLSYYKRNVLTMKHFVKYNDEVYYFRKKDKIIVTNFELEDTLKTTFHLYEFRMSLGILHLEEHLILKGKFAIFGEYADTIMVHWEKGMALLDLDGNVAGVVHLKFVHAASFQCARSSIVLDGNRVLVNCPSLEDSSKGKILFGHVMKKNKNKKIILNLNFDQVLHQYFSAGWLTASNGLGDFVICKNLPEKGGQIKLYIHNRNTSTLDQKVFNIPESEGVITDILFDETNNRLLFIRDGSEMVNVDFNKVRQSKWAHQVTARDMYRANFPGRHNFIIRNNGQILQYQATVLERDRIAVFNNMYNKWLAEINVWELGT
ncbi:uncharacterized protein LOC135491566 [Lineus longissimus]|uniref:uncharacterized protein LOC135491566 n=1 Tax=Lineus longissimus TaxID=88925 RepID=UPI00315DEED7